MTDYRYLLKASSIHSDSILTPFYNKLNKDNFLSDYQIQGIFIFTIFRKSTPIFKDNSYYV